MEVVQFLVEFAFSLILGAVGGWAYLYWKVKGHARSARRVGLHVALTQQDYDSLPNKDDNVLYLITPK